jgi:DNA-binding CsgD family transcriptional regulator
MTNKEPSKQIKLSDFEEMSSAFQAVVFEYEKLYKKSIEPIATSDYMFNYFHWTTDIKAMRIIDMYGIEKMLGYDESVFTLEKSIDIIHPFFKPFVIQYAYIAYQMLSLPKYRPLSNKAHYSIQFPILTANGQYVMVQKNVSIIVTDDEGNSIVNYNRFEVLGEYRNLPIPIKPRVFFRTQLDLSERAKEAEKELNEKVKEVFLKIIGITPKQVKILELLADDKPIDEILDSLDYNGETHKTHSKSILSKARSTLSPLFKEAREVATYLRGMNII